DQDRRHLARACAARRLTLVLNVAFWPIENIHRMQNAHSAQTPLPLAIARRLRTECGPGWPAALPGALCGGEAGPTGRAAGTDRKSVPFRQYTDVLSESPAPTHELAAHGRAASANRGGLLFWLLFSWPRKRKVTRLPQADESLCLKALLGMQPNIQEHRAQARSYGSFAGSARRARAPRFPDAIKPFAPRGQPLVTRPHPVRHKPAAVRRCRCADS